MCNCYKMIINGLIFSYQIETELWIVRRMFWTVRGLILHLWPIRVRQAVVTVLWSQGALSCLDNLSNNETTLSNLFPLEISVRSPVKTLHL